MNKQKQFDITLAETKRNFGHSNVISSRPIYFEYVSKYRRILVTSETGKNCFGETVECFITEVSYKNCELKTWSKTWGDKQVAIGWAKVYVANRDIVLGCLTIKEPAGKQLV